MTKNSSIYNMEAASLGQEQYLNESIEKLENEGWKLAHEVKQLLRSKDPETKLFDSYEFWKIQLLHLAKECEDGDFELLIKKPDGVTSSLFTGMAFKEKMPSGHIRFGLTDKTFSKVVMSEEAIAQISLMEIGIDSRIQAISVLRKVLVEKSIKPITIRVTVTDRNLSRMDGGKILNCTFNHAQGFKFIFKIISSKEPIAAKKLSKKRIQDTSTKVRRANNKIGADLWLDGKKKFIVNPNKKSGYRVNSAYKIDLS